MNNKIKFERKAEAIDAQPFRIVAVERLEDAKWDYFSRHLLDEHDIIANRAGETFVDENGVTNALLVLNKTTGEGILVNSEGADFARYSAYLPFARPYLEYEMSLLADYCVREGAGNTSDGLWAISFDELYEHFGTEVRKGNGIDEMLIEELKTREEIKEAEANEDEIALSMHLECCPQCREFIQETEFSLLSLLGCSFEDVKFCCADSEQVIGCISRINENMITEAGRLEWADVLNAKVESIGTYDHCVLLTLSGCSFSRLKSFVIEFCDFEESEIKSRWFCFENDLLAEKSVEQYEEIDNEEFEVRYAKHILWLHDLPEGVQANFSNCIIEGLDVSHRDFENVNFSNAIIMNCNFSNADLTFANFNNAHISRCNFSDAYMDDIICKDTILKSCNFESCVGMHGNFARSEFYRCNMLACDFTNSCFENSKFTRTYTENTHSDFDNSITEDDWERMGKELEMTHVPR